jgi:hypothetical protein
VCGFPGSYTEEKVNLISRVIQYTLVRIKNEGIYKKTRLGPQMCCLGPFLPSAPYLHISALKPIYTIKY